MGHTSERDLPTAWGGPEHTNVRWSVPLPDGDPTQSSPIVWGNRVIVTTARNKPPEHRVTCYDANDGKQLWTLDKTLEDHADGVAMAKLSADPKAEPTLLIVGSDEGTLFIDPRGKILKHHRVGHVQNPTIADLRPDLPGLETVAINFWGNQGIIHFYDAQGKMYHDFEPCQHGSMLLPVNWTGQPAEYWILSPNVENGGMFDGWGRKVFEFPADGHPDQCVAVLDLTGDSRDEIVVWDPFEVWIYTQDDGAKPGRLYKPRRSPTYTESNYRANVSQPGWSDDKP